MARDDILIQIRADIKDIKTKLGVIHKDFSKMSKGVAGEADKLKGKFAGLKTMIAGAFTIGTLYMFKRGMQECVKVASNLEEQTAKFGTVFEGVMDIANEAVGALTESYGMSTREARELMAGTQDMLVPMGMARDEAANLSFEIVKLATDIGSFNNLPTAQAMEKIKSALVGMYRPMRSVGVVLSATTVEQKALNMGLAESKDELTALNKAVAAYTMSLDMSKDAQGDFIRTSEGFANSLKIMNAAIEDLKSTIGIKLLPVLAKWMGDLSYLSKELTKFMETIGVLETDTLEGLIQQQHKLTKFIEYYSEVLDENNVILLERKIALREVEKQIKALLERKRAHKKALEDEIDVTTELLKLETDEFMEKVATATKKATEESKEYDKIMKTITTDVENLIEKTKDYWGVMSLLPETWGEFREQLSEQLKPYEKDIDEFNRKFGGAMDDVADSIDWTSIAAQNLGVAMGIAFGNAENKAEELWQMITKSLIPALMQAAAIQMGAGPWAPVFGAMGGMFGGMMGAPAPGPVKESAYARPGITIGQVKEARTLSKPLYGRRYLQEAMKQNLNVESIFTWRL